MLTVVFEGYTSQIDCIQKTNYLQNLNFICQFKRNKEKSTTNKICQMNLDVQQFYNIKKNKKQTNVLFLFIYF